MQSALHQQSRAAQLQHLVDFFVDGFEGKQVTVFRAQRPVKRAEGTIFRAEIRVIDVAIDLIGGDARIGFFPAHGIRFHADADQVVGVE